MATMSMRDKKLEPVEVEGESQTQYQPPRKYRPYKDNDRNFLNQKRDEFARTGNYDDWLNWMRGNVDLKYHRSSALGNPQTPEEYLKNLELADKGAFEKRRIKQMGLRIGEEADQFAKNLPSLADQQFGLLRKDIEQNLNQGIKDTRQNYSNRGLLFSGLRQGDEAKKRGQAASMLSQGRYEINKELLGLRDAKRQAAASYGLKTYEQALENAENLYNVNMQNAISRRRNAQLLGQGIGGLIGDYYGRQAGSQPAPMETSEGYQGDFSNSNYGNVV